MPSKHNNVLITTKSFNKCKIKVLFCNSLMYETNFVFGKQCFETFRQKYHLR